MAKSNKKSRASLPSKKKAKEGKKPADSRMTKQEMMNRVVKLFENNPTQSYNYKQISFEIGLTSMAQKRQLVQMLDLMVVQEFLEEPSKGKYRLDNRSGAVIGKLERRTGGKIFLVPEDGSEEVFIMDKYMNRSIVGDIVKVRLFAGKKGQIQEGQVMEVLQRGHDTFVGKLDVNKDYAFLQVDNKLLTNDIFIPQGKLNGGKN